MADLIPAANTPLAPRPGAGARPFMQQAKDFAGQPAIRRTLPFAGAIGVLGAAALAWTVLSPAPQRVLYSELGDAEKAGVTAALDKASIPYKLDPATGAVTVGEDDLYRARMMVASDGAVATPSSGTDLMDSMPIGASRTVEAERLRTARERDLQMTIMEIEGVETVRVHLAQAEKSVFVRDNAPPRASVMLKLTRGRQLSDSQVRAIVNLVSGSVPGLSPNDIKVVDQQGRLLTDPDSATADSDRLNMQARLEEKLRAQVTQLLMPMFGDGNFSTEVQVDLDMNAVTSARESWAKDGVVRSETTQTATTPPENSVGYGVPGALSNTPPAPATVTNAAPGTAAKPGTPGATGTAGTPTTPEGQAAAAPTTDQSTTRTYELGREVAVSNGAPGEIKRLSVAVVLASDAMASRKPAEIAQLKALVSAAVGANLQRGDQVEVIARKFKTDAPVEIPFYEQGWFGTVLRNAVALICVLLVIFFGLRPAIAAMRRNRESDVAASGGEAGEGPRMPAGPKSLLMERLEQMPLPDQVGLAQRYIGEQPDSAMAAIRQMLAEAQPAGKADA
jgi:flagellar M-ring protein FliF